MSSRPVCKATPSDDDVSGGGRRALAAHQCADAAEAVVAIEKSLENVENLSEDRVLRQYLDKQVITAEAEQKAQVLMGEGDAERNRIYAAAYNKDAEFFAFYRSMTAYENGLRSSDTRFLLQPDSDFFRFFSNPSGKPAAAACISSIMLFTGMPSMRYPSSSVNRSYDRLRPHRVERAVTRRPATPCPISRSCRRVPARRSPCQMEMTQPSPLSSLR